MKLLIPIILSFSFFSWGNHHEEKKNLSYEERKAKMLERIDQRISILNESRTCLSSTKDESGLEECRKKWKEKKAQIREKMKSNRNNK